MHSITDANSLISRLASIGNAVVYLLIGLAVIYIVWAVVRYLIMGSDAEGRHEAISRIIWGVVGLAIILSIWGLVSILLNTFGTDNSVPRDRFPTADFVNPNANMQDPLPNPPLP